jgi:hypothetical protein
MMKKLLTSTAILGLCAFYGTAHAVMPLLAGQAATAAAASISTSAAKGGDASASIRNSNGAYSGDSASTNDNRSETDSKSYGFALGQAPGAAIGSCGGEFRLGFGLIQAPVTVDGVCAAVIAQPLINSGKTEGVMAGIEVLNQFRAAHFGDDAAEPSVGGER